MALNRRELSLMVGAAALSFRPRLARAWQHGSMTWDPTQLSNIAGLYRADIGVVQSGGAVSAWNDDGPLGQNLAGLGTNPAWSATSFNGHPGVTFPNYISMADGFISNAAFTFNSSSLSAFALFMMPTIPALGGYPRIWGLVSSGGSDYGTPGISLAIDETNSAVNTYSNGNLGNGGAEVAISAAVPVLAGVILNGSNANLYVNGHAPIGASTAFTSGLGANPNRFNIGGTNVASNGYSNANVAFVVITSAVMSPTDILNLIAWANITWGTSFS